jgi:glycosyltransferase involved in cell wall biosynthesis
MFSLIVCTVDRTAPLERLLHSLARQTDRDFEVVLVDQNEDGRLNAVIARFGSLMRIVHVKAPRGLSSSRNRGLSHARGEIIGFPDDDCHYPATLLEQLRHRFVCARDIALITGRTTDTLGNDSLSAFLKRDAEIDRWNVWKCGNSNTVFVRRSIVDAGVKFNEELGVGASTPFQSGEESAFLLDAMARGARGRFFRDLVVYHDQVGETDAHRARKYARGFGRLLALYAYPRVYVGLCLMRPALRAALGLAAMKPKLARYKSSWALGVYEGYTGTMLGQKALRGSAWPMTSQAASASAGEGRAPLV